MEISSNIDEITLITSLITLEYYPKKILISSDPPGLLATTYEITKKYQRTSHGYQLVSQNITDISQHISELCTNTT